MPFEQSLAQLEISLSVTLDAAVQGLQSQVEQATQSVERGADLVDEVVATLGRARQFVLQKRAQVQAQVQSLNSQANDAIDQVETALSEAFAKARAQVDDLYARSQSFATDQRESRWA